VDRYAAREPMESAEPALVARELRHHYRVALGLRRREVLTGFDVELARGSALGLVGPNGSGKSTFLRVASGIERPASGTLAVLGGSPATPAIRRRLGYLPEDSPFPPELPARAALELCGSMRGLRGRDLRERARTMLGKVGLGERLRTPLGRFSRGMLRRFGLAQAYLHEPELVLLDEPTAGLDAPGFGVLDELMTRARARGAATVVATHLWSDVERPCDALAIVADGRIVASGAPSDVAAGATSLLDLYRRHGVA